MHESLIHILIWHRCNVSPSLNWRLSYLSILFLCCRTLDFRAAILSEQGFSFSPSSFKSFKIGSPLYWYFYAKRRSAFSMPSGHFTNIYSRSRSLELLKLFNQARPLTTWWWKVRKARSNNNNIIRLYHRYLLSSRLPWPHRSNSSNPKQCFLINVFFYFG